MASSVTMVTFTAPVNIALIKYWGKRNEELILPLASSLSVTLNQDEMCAKTTVAISEHFTEDRFWLNNDEQSLDNPRLATCLKEVRRRAFEKHCDNEDRAKKWKHHVHIASTNNFPTAAGLASSAAGYACLVSALVKVYDVDGDVSELARRGSGSACRSVYGGFVEWVCGEAENGSDSIAHQVASPDYWPDLHVLVLVVADGQKAIPSSKAMQRSVCTSDFVHYWANECVPQQITAMKEAIVNRDFEKLANLSMKGSNQLHALCQDTFPPVIFMNDTSHCIVSLVHAFNAVHGETRVMYTFDAGPNACLLVPKRYVDEVSNVIRQFFPPSPEQTENYFRGLNVKLSDCGQCTNYAELSKEARITVKLPGALKFIIHTKIGDGPREVVDISQCLLDSNGMPLTK